MSMIFSLKGPRNGCKNMLCEYILVQSQKLPVTFFPDELKLYKKNLPPN